MRYHFLLVAATFASSDADGHFSRRRLLESNARGVHEIYSGLASEVDTVVRNQVKRRYLKGKKDSDTESDKNSKKDTLYPEEDASMSMSLSLPMSMSLSMSM